MKNLSTYHTNPFFSAIRIYSAIALLWLVVILALSIFEYNTLSSSLSAHTILLQKLLCDTAFWCRTYIILLIPFVILYRIAPRPARWILIALVLLLVIGQAALIKYFTTALVPLGADLYGYSWKDITQTAGASGTVHLTGILFAAAAVLVLAFILKRITSTPLLPLWLGISIAIISLILLFTGLDKQFTGKKFASEFDANVSLNKLDFFLTQSRTHFFPPDQGIDIYSDEYAGGDSGNADTLASAFIYPDETGFPFYHIDSTRDALSPFFHKSPSAPPNIVIILVEGLGRAFTNNDAYLGNFTPFLDSLSGKSLYWRNFLSQGGRTFAVLPSILGSLPFAKNGFLELGNAMPDHLSLLQTLKTNGYQASFYYGGDAHFDNMDLILQKERIDELNDGKTFPAGYTRLPSQNGFSWGYNDNELFRHYLETRPAADHKPQCSIILTVSTHSPFLLNDPATYGARLEKRFDVLGFDEKTKAAHRQFKAQYMSILYADDALRNFFTAYAKRPDYANTIFLITGDHRMPEIPMRTKIDRFHVPLILWSPLLSRSKTFASISTHYDITPSLLAFLHASYGLPRPNAAQWMGAGLDTAAAFRNIHAYPLMQTKTDLVDFVKGEYHLNGSQLFRLSADMDEEPVATPQPQITGLFNIFLRKNDKLAAGARLLPDTVHTFLQKN